MEEPDITQPSGLLNPSGALLLRASAIGSFASAFSSQALYSGLLTDELTDLSGGDNPVDRRIVNAQNSFSNTTFPYDGLSAARLNALIAINAMKSYQPTMHESIGELYDLVGYVEILFAEGMCSGVPLGTLDGVTPKPGAVYDRAQMLRQALIDFDSASAYVSAADSIRTLTLIGRSRALRDSGDWAHAVAAADSVQTVYAYTTQYSQQTPLQQNQFALYIGSYLVFSVSDREGQNGLDFVSANDPRLPVAAAGTAAVGTVYVPTEYSTVSSPMTLASGIESRLVDAEASLVQGDASAWLASLNALRSDSADTHVAGLTPLSDPGNDADRLALTYRERAFWLFGTGHRQGDLRLLVERYSEPVSTVFPTGLYQGGPLSYGTDFTFVPFGENGNPNYHGCLNRN